MDPEAEIDAMRICLASLDHLERHAQIRVLQWLEDRLTSDALRAETLHSSPVAAPRTASKA